MSRRYSRSSTCSREMSGWCRCRCREADRRDCKVPLRQDMSSPENRTATMKIRQKPHLWPYSASNVACNSPLDSFKCSVSSRPARMDRHNRYNLPVFLYSLKIKVEKNAILQISFIRYNPRSDPFRNRIVHSGRTVTPQTPNKFGGQDPQV